MEKSIKLINRLSEDVVNKIAAGEVIQRPANAVKEMLENSLDAKSSNIIIQLKDGGLKYLSIQDNGTGIHKNDMYIVCERFTTSKLNTFEDLTNISTYGFRGEALASISHVAHVTIISKVTSSICAYRGEYCDGKLKDVLKPCAGNIGTQIVVEDLFYNVPLRKNSLRSFTEEHQKVVDVVSRYAIHNSSVGFVVKKQGDTNPDVKTPANSTQTDNIRVLHGPSIAKELLEVTLEDNRLGIKLKGLVTNANYSSKKRAFILFINNRLVDSADLRKSVESLYAVYLPKGTYPFIYLSLDVNADNIDVNVHPTKHEVHFLYEDEIISLIHKAIDNTLLGANNSRSYLMQTLLPSKVFLIPNNEEKIKSDQITSTEKPLYAQNMVRTDSKNRTIDAFFHNDPKTNFDLENLPFDSSSSKRYASKLNGSINEIKMASRSFGSSLENHLENNKNKNKGMKRIIKLNSVLKLRKEIESKEHLGLKELFQNNTFVGCVDEQWSLMQNQTRLYLINTYRICTELFYQVIINDFGNLGIIKLSEPASIYDLVILALDCPENGWTPEDGPKEELANYVVTLLKSKSDMLFDYFSIKIDENGNLCSIPLLIENFIPILDDLPKLVIRLATEVDWDEEKNCFQTFAKEIAQFYIIKYNLLPLGDDDKIEINEEISIKENSNFIENKIDKFNYEHCTVKKENIIYNNLIEKSNDNKNINCKNPFEVMPFHSKNQIDCVRENFEYKTLNNNCINQNQNYNIDVNSKNDDAFQIPFNKKEEQINCIYNNSNINNNSINNLDNICNDSIDKNSSSDLMSDNNNEKINNKMDFNNPNKPSNWKWMIEHAIYPYLRTSFMPPQILSTDGSILQIANLNDLYKVFERC